MYTLIDNIYIYLLTMGIENDQMYWLYILSATDLQGSQKLNYLP